MKIAGSRLKQDSLQHLINYLSKAEKLQELDISRTGLKPNEIINVVNTISKNEKINSMKLHLAVLKLYKANFVFFLNSFQTTSLGKWVLLNLEDNGLSHVEFQTLLGLFPKMNALEEVRLGYNFNYKMGDLGQLLVKLLDIATIKKISIHGDKKHALCHLVIPLLKALPSNTTLKSLELGYNYIGDKAAEEIINVVTTNQSLIELKCDGKKVNNLKILLDLLEAESLNTILTSCPFPIEDAVRISSKASDSQRPLINQKISVIQNKVEMNIMKNRISAGILSILASKNIAHLNKRSEELTQCIVTLLENLPVNVHSMVSSVLGLPLPFQSEEEKPEDGGETQPANEEENFKTYDGEGASGHVVEVVDQDLKNFQTLNYNTLKLKRPSLFAQRNRLENAQASHFEIPVNTDKNKDNSLSAASSDSGPDPENESESKSD